RGEPRRRRRGPAAAARARPRHGGRRAVARRDRGRGRGRDGPDGRGSGLAQRRRGVGRRVLGDARALTRSARRLSRDGNNGEGPRVGLVSVRRTRRGRVPVQPSLTQNTVPSTLAAAHAVAEEQHHLDAALARRAELLAALDAQLAAPTPPVAPHDAVERSRRAGLRRRRTDLERAASGLVFGRLDTVGGETRHVGRVGIPAADDDADPLVLDWRADGARAFYTATAREPQGLARRRHVRTAGDRVTGVDDEPLDDAAARAQGEDGLVGEGALLAALSERRTGRMGTAVATLPAEHAAILRAPADRTLVVQGGPGTGKTVVALHRVAYLLFTHPHLAERGVLLLGPSPRFLDYVAQVLPALGETAVVSATCDTLVPGVAPERGEER